MPQDFESTVCNMIDDTGFFTQVQAKAGKGQELGEGFRRFHEELDQPAGEHLRGDEGHADL